MPQPTAPQRAAFYCIEINIEWAPGPVLTGTENFAPPGFDPWAVQPVASRYIDCTLTDHFVVKILLSLH